MRLVGCLHSETHRLLAAYYHRIVADNKIAFWFFIPCIVFFDAFPAIGATFVGIFLLAWGTAIYRLRKVIWAKHNKRLPFARIWYEFIPFGAFLDHSAGVKSSNTVHSFNSAPSSSYPTSSGCSTLELVSEFCQLASRSVLHMDKFVPLIRP
jgi:hypothetical protein